MAFWSATDSKLKMVVLFPSGQKNQVWYSPIKHNHKPDETIIHAMVKRLGQQIKGYNKIHIYEVASNSLKYIYE
ncbi:hypothetical protein [Flavobacterium sp. J27]|uniref:hypothetical protein n=1 Tax=Flavobacterium sp. J27 TaxID=2060419 RepID=UPI0010313091|nr:hypothetical protein [Flavobacterium sp. J27]